MEEAKEIQASPSEDFVASPSEENVFDWYHTSITFCRVSLPMFQVESNTTGISLSADLPDQISKEADFMDESHFLHNTPSSRLHSDSVILMAGLKLKRRFV